MKTRDDLKGFLKQHPKTAKVLGTVFTVWRGSTATRSGTEGRWAAHKHEKWSEKTGLPPIRPASGRKSHRISTSSSAMVGCSATVASKSAFLSRALTAMAAP